MKYIIGISAFYHESSVALIEDGIVKEFLKEETFTRIKGTNTFPSLCLNYLKNKYSLCSNNVDACVFYEKPLLSWARITYFSMKRPLLRSII
jgi:carbamoyltransferase